MSFWVFSMILISQTISCTDKYDITCTIDNKVTLNFEAITYERAIEDSKRVAHFLNLDESRIECLKQFVSF